MKGDNIRLELQALVLNILYVETPKSPKGGWVLASSILSLSKEIYPEVTPQAINGALITLGNAGLIKFIEMNDRHPGGTVPTSYWRLTPATEKVEEIYDPVIMLPVLNRIAKMQEPKGK